MNRSIAHRKYMYTYLPVRLARVRYSKLCTPIIQKEPTKMPQNATATGRGNFLVNVFLNDPFIAKELRKEISEMNTKDRPNTMYPYFKLA